MSLKTITRFLYLTPALLLSLFTAVQAHATGTTVRIDTGAGSSYKDSQGYTWISDRYFTGGTAYTNTNAISGTPAPGVFHTERYGRGSTSFAYNVPVTNGTYSVSLEFAETYVSGPGKRIFSVTIDGQQALSNFDIYAAAGGMNTAVVRTFTVPVSNGKITINFIPGSAENPKVNGIQILPASGALAVTTSSLPSGTVSKSYSAGVTASGGTSPYSWKVQSGSLPSGLSLSSSGTISGTPSATGTSSFTLQVSDAASHTASANLSIQVGTASGSPSVSISSPSSGATISGSVTVSGTASDSVSLSSVQVAVDSGAFSAASGTSSWTFPLNTSNLSNGPHTITAKVTDSVGSTATSSPQSVMVNNSGLATDCTFFASPTGNDSNSGYSSSAPKTFLGAASVTQPGSVLCLMAGTYNLSSSFTPPHSGTASQWIVYKAYGDGPVTFVYTGAADASPMFRIDNGGSFPNGGPSYLEFRGLNMNGNGNSGDAFWCGHTHHLKFDYNTMHNTGGSGIATRDCDYLTADHNLVYHDGYRPASTPDPQWYGWTSGISFNSDQWYDSYSGLHNVISNNIVVGEYDSSTNHTDGNGIILDLSNGSYTPSTANTPPVLIANNVVYGNGGRCIEAFIVTNFWIVNNTCYKNTLDPAEPGFPEFDANSADNGYFINNIAYAMSSSNPSYLEEGSYSNVQYFADLYYGSSPSSSSSQLKQGNPQFLAAPSLSMGGYGSALLPNLLRTDLTLLTTSPAVGQGIDPSTLSGLSSSLVSDLRQYIYTDINGNARPHGGGADLGAYQH